MAQSFARFGSNVTLLELAGDHLFDLVLSDMAPNLSGMDSVDQPRSIYLAELAFDLAENFLNSSGVFVVKLFQGAGSEELISSFFGIPLHQSLTYILL